jgi:hypothetical protein
MDFSSDGLRITLKHWRRHGNQRTKVEPLQDAKLIIKSRMSSVSRAFTNAMLYGVAVNRRKAISLCQMKVNRDNDLTN